MRRKSHSTFVRPPVQTETIIDLSQDRKWVLCKRVKTLFLSREVFEEILKRRALDSYFSEMETPSKRKGE